MKKLFVLILSFIYITAATGAIAQSAPGNSVDLLWEGETSAPPFYAGRPLPSAGNLVRVVAMPNVIQGGHRLTSSQLIFNWVKDRNPIQSASGRSKDILEYRADPSGAASIISVEILTERNERLTEARVTIPATKPKLILYRVEPLTSPARVRALIGVTPIGSAETTLLAQPFGFSSLDLANRRVTFDWLVNGERITALREDQRFFTVAAPASPSLSGNRGEPSQGSGSPRSGEAGEVKLSVTARSDASPLQTATRAATLGFGLSEFNF
ncbi:MAG: hypothetical protein AAB415_03330 [Patescibacteria group bacterium]